MGIRETKFNFPHELYLKGLNEDTYTLIGMCKDQPNTGGEKVTIADRTDIVFSSLIFIPKSIDRVFLPGEEIKIMGTYSNVRLIGTVAKYSDDWLANRIWV